MSSKNDSAVKGAEAALNDRPASAMGQMYTNDGRVVTIGIYNERPLETSYGDSGWRIRAATPDQSPIWNGQMDSSISVVSKEKLAELLLFAVEMHLQGALATERLMPAGFCLDASTESRPSSADPRTSQRYAHLS